MNNNNKLLILIIQEKINLICQDIALYKHKLI